MFWEMLPSALSQNTSPVKQCIWMDATAIPFFWRTYPQYFNVTCGHLKKKNGLKSVNGNRLSKQTGPWKVFKFSHIVWEENAWWLSSGYSGKTASGGQELCLCIFTEWCHTSVLFC